MAALALIGTIEVAPGRREEVIARLREHRARSLRDEPGTLQFEVLAPRASETIVHAYEVYCDDAAFAVHRSGASIARWRKETAGMVVKVSIIRCDLVQSSASVACI